MKIRVGSMSVFFRDIPLLLQGGLLTLQTIKQNNPHLTKKNQPFCELALCFQRILEQLRMATIAAAKRRMLIQNRK